MKNIFAFTPPQSQPPYISVTQNASGEFVITVRSDKGDTASMTLHADQMKVLAASIQRNLGI